MIGPTSPPHLTVILLVFSLVLAVSTLFVWVGNSWVGLIPIGCALALAAAWVRSSITGVDVSVVAIGAALVLAVGLTAVWVVPPPVRAFHAAMDDFVLRRREAVVDAPEPELVAVG